MPLRVYYNNNGDLQPCTIRPTPLVSINTTPLKNGAGDIFGVTYEIVLTGTLLADQGTPYGIKQDNTAYNFYPDDGPSPALIGPYNAFDNNRSHYENNRPPRQIINNIEASNSIFSKQKTLRALFSKEGYKLEITDFNDDEATIICYPRFNNISFQEGIYVDRCDYTISLEADILFNKDLKIDHEGTFIPTLSGNLQIQNINESQLINRADLAGVFISDFSEEWSLETDESVGESTNIPRSYRITHSVNAVGKKHYCNDSSDFKPAWMQAKQFVQRKLYDNITKYPNIMGKIGSGLINLVESYGGYNHVRSEQLSESAGTYSATETWLLASGSAYENFNISLSSSVDNPFVSVNIDGSIRGLTTIPASGYDKLQTSVSAFDNALKKYNKVSNSGQFGLSSDIYKRANNLVAVQLNSQPKSISVTTNQYAGEIGYSLQFDNRPTNIISGVLVENISVNDTYPGDVFAVIPVIGRKTGPVLQYIGGRSEYRRDVQISLIMDYTKIPYEGERNGLLLRKPSIAEPTASQLFKLVTELSPANEPGVRKYFLSPPSENWSPKDGAYSLSLSWTYELDS
jgi:hypothetical protein